jgi:hypothetical protein
LGKYYQKLRKFTKLSKPQIWKKLIKNWEDLPNSQNPKSCVNWTIYIFTTNFGKFLKPRTFFQTLQTTNLEIFIILLQIQKKLIEN